MLMRAGLELPADLAEIAENWNVAKPAVLDSLIPTSPARQSCILDIVELAKDITKRGLELEEKLVNCVRRDSNFLRVLLNRHYRKIDLDLTASEDTNRNRLKEVGLTWSEYRDLSAIDQELRDWFDDCGHLYSKLIEPETWSKNTSESVRLALDWVRRCFSRATGFTFDDFPPIYANGETLPLAVDLFFPVDWEAGCSLCSVRHKDDVGGFDGLRTPPTMKLRHGFHDLEAAAVALFQTISPLLAAASASESREVKGVDPTAFRPAKEFLDPERFPHYKAIRKFLETHPNIRRENPTPRRLVIHAGDWQGTLAREKKSPDPLDAPAALVDAAKEIERRKAMERNRQAGT
jgi:hypothetical protein